jgi:hypothetical protein
MGRLLCFRTTLPSLKEQSVAKDTKDIVIEEPKPQATPASTPVPEPQRQQVVVDASKAHAAYSNFCRVTGTPEELIIDFGLNTQPMGVPTEPIEISERIVMNYYTAKRMMGALQMSLQRHEAAFGVLETDVQKRVMPGIMRASGTPPR